MEDLKVENGTLVAISVDESTQVRGGVSWETIRNIAIVLRHIVNFFIDYSQEMKDGFNDGWESVK